MTISPGKVKDLQVVLAAMAGSRGQVAAGQILSDGGRIADISSRGVCPCEAVVSGVLLGPRYAKQAMVGRQSYGHSRDGNLSVLPSEGLGLVQRNTHLATTRVDSVPLGRVGRGGVGCGSLVASGGSGTGRSCRRILGRRDANSPYQRQGSAGMFAGGDSRTANAAIREFRGSMLSPFRTEVVRQIWLLSIEMGASLLPVEYVNTKDNDVADQESRELDQDDWAISDAVWALVEGAFGPHDWDRFASMENRRCKLYTAKRYQPECYWPQALSQPWEGRNNYCCPPESQLLKVLQLIRVSKAEATVIAPTYQGRWWPLLQELLRETGSTSCQGGVSSRPVRACRTVAAAGLSAAAPVCSVSSKKKGFVAEAHLSTGEYEMARILDEKKDQFLIEWLNYESPSWEAAEAIYDKKGRCLCPTVLPHSLAGWVPTHTAPLGFEDKWLRVYVRSQKNDQEANGQFILIEPTWSVACPCRLLVDYLREFKFQIGSTGQGDEPLFVSLNDNVSPITSGAVNSAVKRVAKVLGLGPNVSGHSLRIGGCTAAAAAGIPMEIIRVIGGWFSDAMLGYIRAAAAPALFVTQRMGL